MKKEDERMLEADGWNIDCLSPFELSHSETESFAKNYAAEIVVDNIREYVKKYKHLPFSDKPFKYKE